MSSLASYVKKIADVFLDLPESVIIESLDSHESRSTLQRFSESEETVLYLSSSSSPSSSLGSPILLLTNEWINDGNGTPSNGRIALIKLYDRPILETYPISKQVQVVCTGQGEVPESDNDAVIDNRSIGADTTSLLSVSRSDGLPLLQGLQRINKYFIAPGIAKAAFLHKASQASTGSGVDMGNLLEELQKKTRELDSALELCQQATIIPVVRIDIPPSVESLVKDLSKEAEALLSDCAEHDSADQVAKCFDVLGLNEEKKITILDEANRCVLRWQQGIRRLTSLVVGSNKVSLPSLASLERERAFWRDLVLKLKSTLLQLGSPAVLCGKIVLRDGKRSGHGVLEGLVTDMKAAVEVAVESLAFIKDLPIEDVHDASDLLELRSRAGNCWSHFTCLKDARYPYVRATTLLRSVVATVASRIVSLLRRQNLMYCPLEDFRRFISLATAVVSEWESQYATLRLTLKEVARRRDEEPVVMSFERMTGVQTRLRELANFRERHEHLLQVCTVVLKDANNAGMVEVAQRDYGIAILDALRDAYDVVAQAGTHQKASSSISNVFSTPTRPSSDHHGHDGEGHSSGQANDEIDSGIGRALNTGNGITDISSSGIAVWNRLVAYYDRKLEYIESGIIRMLTSRLSGCRDADDMFGVFATFNSLFYRPAIYHAVAPFRVLLVKSIHKGVQRLREKFRSRYEDGAERYLADSRDIPPLAGRIVWAQQIERQMNYLLGRMRFILGDQWQAHDDGKLLMEECDDLRGYLSTSKLYSDWLTSQMKSDVLRYKQTHEFLFLVDNHAVVATAPENTMSSSLASARPLRLPNLGTKGESESSTDHTDSAGHLTLRVNFDPRRVTIFKEVRYLEGYLLPTLDTIHKSIPLTIRSVASEAEYRYSIFMSLQASLAVFTECTKEITCGNHLLLSSHVSAVQTTIEEAFGGSSIPQAGHSTSSAESSSNPRMRHRHFAGNVEWIRWSTDTPKLKQWVSLFASKCSVLRDRVDDVKLRMHEVDQALHALETCEYSFTSLHTIIEGLQNKLDTMQTKGYANFNAWVSDLDLRVEKVLAKRLSRALVKWSRLFLRRDLREACVVAGASDTYEDEEEDSDDEMFLGALDPVKHKISVVNQVLTVAPSLRESRASWIQKANDCARIVTSLTRLNTARYAVFSTNDTEGHSVRDYSNLLSVDYGQVSQAVLVAPLRVIEAKVQEAEQYCQQWLSYQTLWDTPINSIDGAKLGSDLKLWSKLLEEMRLARSATLEIESSNRAFGPIVIDYHHVQLKINQKYDSWQQQVQSRLVEILFSAFRSLMKDLRSCRDQVETVSLSHDRSCGEIAAAVKLIREAEQGLPVFESRCAELGDCEAMLTRQRVHLPTDRPQTDAALDALASITSVLSSKLEELQENAPMFRERLHDEESCLVKEIDDAQGQWHQLRGDMMLRGSNDDRGALDMTSDTFSPILVLHDNVDMLLCRSEQLLESREVLGVTGDNYGDDNHTLLRAPANLRDTLNELENWKLTWDAVRPICERIAQIGRCRLNELNVVSMRKTLDEVTMLLEGLAVPDSDVLGVQAMRGRIAEFCAMQPLIRDLTSDTLRGRHWVVLREVLGIPLPDLAVNGVASSNSHHITRGTVLKPTVQQIWESRPTSHRIAIAECLSCAQGELALEQYLEEVRSVWSTTEMKVVQKDDITVLGGWDEILHLSEEHLTALSSLRQSPYFQNVAEFVTQTDQLENELSHLRLLLEGFADVQRRWIYLREIFGNADFASAGQSVLGSQLKKFEEINIELMSLMRLVSVRPSVMYLLTVENLARRLEHYGAVMGRMHKALGDYLEAQRQLFPRFYFVNNEELAEIIGNRKEPARVQRYLGKMFAGVSAIRIQVSSTLVTAVLSEEGEELSLVTSVDVSGGAQTWLNALSTQTQQSLLASVDKATSRQPAYDATADILIPWIETSCSQTLLLSAHICWTRYCEDSIATGVLQGLQDVMASRLRALCGCVGQDLSVLVRRKAEQCVTEAVHHRDVATILYEDNISSPTDFTWLYYLRYYYALKAPKWQTKGALKASLAGADFDYGFEYQGMREVLVLTPLTDRCYLSLAQALKYGLGGNPFGPAGTGKTESVKMLGTHLGRYVLVFNCDSSFDYIAMGRIFHGLCHVGAWGCFDEFNRLSELVLSAVSQQILSIQSALRAGDNIVELGGRKVCLHEQVGIFITLNPGYSGRSNLPDNLKLLFRAVAMIAPDQCMIARVTLLKHSLVSAEMLSSRIVSLFSSCKTQLSEQLHYDFGLRALKSVLEGAGELKRKFLREQKDRDNADGNMLSPNQSSGYDDGDSSEFALEGVVHAPSVDEIEVLEERFLVTSVLHSVLPKLVARDIDAFMTALKDAFPGASVFEEHNPYLVRAIMDVCAERGLQAGKDNAPWLEKVLQLDRVMSLRNGIMLVGSAGTGKSTTWEVLFEALSRLQDSSTIPSSVVTRQATENSSVDGGSAKKRCGYRHECHIIDPKVMSKEELFGRLDPHSLEWTDGIFTSLIRKASDMYYGTSPSSLESPSEVPVQDEDSSGLANMGRDKDAHTTRMWIIMDGDVDPLWAESLNSVLDDNKVLTLPSGDRIAVPPNVRIILEVESLKHATMATVSRCGMIWYKQDLLPCSLLLRREFDRLKALPLELRARSISHAPREYSSITNKAQDSDPTDQHIAIAELYWEVLCPHFSSPDGLAYCALQYTAGSLSNGHVFGACGHQKEASIMTMSSILCEGLHTLLSFSAYFSQPPSSSTESPTEFSSIRVQVEAFAQRCLLYALAWGMGAPLVNTSRDTLVEYLCSRVDPSLLSSTKTTYPTISSDKLLDHYVTLVPEKGDGAGANGSKVTADIAVVWRSWHADIPEVDIEPEQVSRSDVVVPTTDTTQNVELLRALLRANCPFILCGPPGSGKTMTLTHAVRKAMGDAFQMVELSFSSRTTPELVLKTLKQYCEVVETPTGPVMRPLHKNTSSRSVHETSTGKQSSSAGRLIVFCDEVNLPEQDSFGTQRVISLLRLLIGHGGYWEPKSRRWVRLCDVHFIGACNPPEDEGRVRLCARFTRRVPVIFIGYPKEVSLKQIYSAFLRALLKGQALLRPYVVPICDAMVDFYLRNQKRFSPIAVPQYIYSPRELSRWVRGLYEALSGYDQIAIGDFARLWAHEALRIFADRLVSLDEVAWCNDQLDSVFITHLAQVMAIDHSMCLQRPILFSRWCNVDACVETVSKRALVRVLRKDFYTFCEEEQEQNIVLFDDVLDWILRIDNVLHNPMGHMLLVGESGTGKSILTRFVAWKNGMSVFRLKTHARYSLSDFDADLRKLLVRVGAEGKMTCFLFDESNILSAAFLERMNSLLASGEIPGLFVGDDLQHLISACREYEKSEGDFSGILNEEMSPRELYERFVSRTQRNLHVIFTINPMSGGFDRRYAASPALFNRCTVSWMGGWSDSALAQVCLRHLPAIFSADRKHLSEADILMLGSSSEAGAALASVSDISRDMQAEIEEIAPNRPVDNSRQDVLSIRLGGEEDIPDNLPVGTTLVGGASMQQCVTAAMLCFHHTAKGLVEKEVSKGGQDTHISPRHFLALCEACVEMEKYIRGKLDAAQEHIESGLKRLLHTKESVASLRLEAIAFEEELQEKEADANQKLNLMMEKQREAEERKVEAERLAKELQQQNEEMNAKRLAVEEELSEAEPSLLRAKEGVSNIKRTQLDEIRALGRPPKAIQMTVEMVALMLGEPDLEWNEIRKVMRRDDFIPTVVKFDPLALEESHMEIVKKKYLDGGAAAGFTYETVDRASKACGPLFLWAASQIQYAAILRKIEPLRQRVAVLNDEISELEVQQREVSDQVYILESDIKTYKEEYSSAIREAEQVRSDMLVVKKKVRRAEGLVTSLAEEEERWHGASETFRAHRQSLFGEVLLTAAFLTYAGIFDNTARNVVFERWTKVLHDLHLDCRHTERGGAVMAGGTTGTAEEVHQHLDTAILAHLAPPEKQIIWKSHGLHVDDRLALQNAILIETKSRYPLIVDPSGQAQAFLKAAYSQSKLVVCSFYEENFYKTLVSCVRFGTPLLVLDANAVDATIYPLLSGQRRLSSGRTLVRIGPDEVDISPRFHIYLLTSNASSRFAPALSSKVSLVNFTTTFASLKARVLSTILRVEQPEADKKRLSVLAELGRLAGRLHELEQMLLKRIASVEGEILEDDTVADALTDIKKEASQLQTEKENSEKIIRSLREGADLYEPFAQQVTSAYFLLRAMCGVSYLYQFSLGGFMHLLQSSLEKSHSVAGEDGRESTESYAEHSHSRIATLRQHLFSELTIRTLRSLHHDDQVIFIAHLAGIASRVSSSPKLNTHDSHHRIEELVSSSELAHEVPGSDMNPVALNSQVDKLVEGTLGKAFLEFWQRKRDIIDLKRITESEVPNGSVPIFIVSAAGSNVATRLVNLARQENRTLTQVSLGSDEGFRLAEQTLNRASVDGSWVLLRNVHLCLDWLQEFIVGRWMHGLSGSGGLDGTSSNKHVDSEGAEKLHPEFRLFMTSEMTPSLPIPLLQASEVVIIDGSVGVRASMLRFLSAVTADNDAFAQKGHKEGAVTSSNHTRGRIIQLLARLHAVILERSRYAPSGGWQKVHGFSDADGAYAVAILDSCMMHASDKTIIDDSNHTPLQSKPELLPWKAMQTLLEQCVYGAIIDNDEDSTLLVQLVKRLFNDESFKGVSNEKQDSIDVHASPNINEGFIEMPSQRSMSAFEDWLKDLPTGSSPAWIGLPKSADIELEKAKGTRMLEDMEKVRKLMHGD